MSKLLNLFRSKKVKMSFLPLPEVVMAAPLEKVPVTVTMEVSFGRAPPDFSESKVVGLEKTAKKKASVQVGPASEIQVLASRLGGAQLEAAQFLIQEVYFLSTATGGLVQTAIEGAPLPPLMEIVARLSGEDLTMATDIARFIRDEEIMEVMSLVQLLREKREHLLATI